jgi:hypothetical protein
MKTNRYDLYSSFRLRISDRIYRFSNFVELIPAARRTYWSARRVGVAAAREMKKLPEPALSTKSRYFGPLVRDHLPSNCSPGGDGHFRHVPIKLRNGSRRVTVGSMPLVGASTANPVQPPQERRAGRDTRALSP